MCHHKHRHHVLTLIFLYVQVSHEYIYVNTTKDWLLKKTKVLNEEICFVCYGIGGEEDAGGGSESTSALQVFQPPDSTVEQP